MPSSTSVPRPTEALAAGGVRPRAAALRRWAWSLALAVVVIDQASKWLIVTRIMDPPRVIEVLPFFNLVMAWNRGVSFGLLASGSPYAAWILVGVAAAIVLALTVWLRRLTHPLPALAIGLIIGGAIGNVIDRLRFGAVADFLDFHLAGYHWPAFNAADSAITVGVALLLVDSLFGHRKSRK